jgi:hypothetical protein
METIEKMTEAFVAKLVDAVDARARALVTNAVSSWTFAKPMAVTTKTIAPGPTRFHTVAVEMGGPGGLATGRAKRAYTMTPARRAELRLQGQYMALVRGLNSAAIARVKARAESHGVKSAILMAKRERRAAA